MGCSHKTHEAIRECPERFAMLPYAGMMPDYAGGWLELRDCTCGSTIARSIGQLARLRLRIALALERCDYRWADMWGLRFRLAMTRVSRGLAP